MHRCRHVLSDGRCRSSLGRRFGHRSPGLACALTLQLAASCFSRDTEAHQPCGSEVDQRQWGAGVHFGRAPERGFDIKKFAPDPALKPVPNKGFGNPCRQVLPEVDDLEGFRGAGKGRDPKAGAQRGRACAMGVTRT